MILKIFDQEILTDLHVFSMTPQLGSLDETHSSFF
jgi:hypothetical protein